MLNGSNMYAYCGNNPVMYRDPGGMDYTSDMLALLFSALKITGFIAQLPEVLWNPLTKAVGVIINAAGKINVAEVISKANIIVENLQELGNLIGRLVSLSGLTPNQVGAYLDTGIRYVVDIWKGSIDKWTELFGTTVEAVQKSLTWIKAGLIAFDVLSLPAVPLLGALGIITGFIVDGTFIWNLEHLIEITNRGFDRIDGYLRAFGIWVLDGLDWVKFLLGEYPRTRM